MDKKKQSKQKVTCRVLGIYVHGIYIIFITLKSEKE